MLRTPVAVVGLMGVAFLAGGFAPVTFNISSFSKPQELFQAIFPAQDAVAVKGDRLAGPFPASRSTVSIVELDGADHATVILRGRDGKVVYRSDPRKGVTTLSKNVELPVITVKEDVTGVPSERPAGVNEEMKSPRPEGKKRRSTVGCMGDVSPLAKASADRMPSLCLASIEPSSL